MKTINLHTSYKKILSDTITPVSIYLKVRDRFPNSLLLESSDYHTNDNSFSYICFNPIASIKIENDVISTSFPDGFTDRKEITPEVHIPQVIHEFASSFTANKIPLKFINNGLFGYTSYDAVRYFESVTIKKRKDGLPLR